MLELSVRVVERPAADHLGAVVRFRADGAAMEVGRVSIADREQTYQFNVSAGAGARIRRLRRS